MKQILLILDVIICTCSFFGLYFLKTGSFIPRGEYLTLFWVYIFLWVLLSVYYNKHKYILDFSFKISFQTLLFSSTSTLFFLTLVVSLTEMRIISRLFVLTIIIAPFLVELLVNRLIIQLRSFNKIVLKDEEISDVNTEKAILRLSWLFSGILLFSIIFLTMVRIKSGSFGYYPWSEHIFLLLIAVWTISIGLTYKYWYYPSRNLYYQITPFIKSGIIMFVLTGLVIYFFRLESLSRLVLFGTIAVYSILEIIIFTIIFLEKNETVSLPKKNVIKKVESNIFGQESLSINSETEYKDKNYVDIYSLFNRLTIKDSKLIIQFLGNNIDRMYKKDSVTLFSTTSLENINILKDQSQNLLMNIHKLNDIRRLNEYLITCGNKIKPGGEVFGGFIPLEEIRNHLQEKMPRLLYLIYFPFHFFFYRIFPKIPRIRYLYFILTNGRNRVISKAEIYGRLSFCGYKVVAEKMIGSTLYFISRKLRTVSTERNPSYGPIVKLKRIGLDRKVITIYKFRTMHPYSEFIQQELYNNQSLNPDGKFKDDFRLTNWGRLLRKFWIDELPQLFNWIHGDVTMVGVRALSEHYFSLYPNDLQELRTQFKPGLVPPYYADMPKNFDEIIKSERKYLERKQLKKFSTDIIYFWKAFMNIIYRGARSQ